MAKYNSQNIKEKKGLKTKTKWGISLFVISLALFILVAFNIIVPFHKFVLGTFGYCIYPILLVLMAVGILLMSKKRYYVEKFYVVVVCLLFLIIVSFFQLVLTNLGVGFGEYLANCYNNANTVGGVLMGIITFVLYSGLGIVGTIITDVIAIILCVAFIIDHFLKLRDYQYVAERTLSFPKEEKEEKEVKRVSKKSREFNKLQETKAVKTAKPNIMLDGFMKEQEKKEQKNEAQVVKKESVKSSILNNSSYKSEDDIAVKIFGEEFINNIRSTSKPKEPEKKEYNLSELYTKRDEQAEVFAFNDRGENKPSRFIHTDDEELLTAKLDINDNLFIQKEAEEQKINKPEPVVASETKVEQNDSIIEEKENFANQDEDEIIFEETEIEDNNFEENPFMNSTKEFEDDFEEFEETPEIEDEEEEEIVSPPKETFVQKQNYNFKPIEQKKEQEIEQNEEKPKVKKVYAPYVKPPIDLLTTKSTIPQINEQEYQTKAQILEQTLESFKISAKVVGITRGPAVTRYELQMPVGIPVKRITQHVDDITMMMESRASVRIETPIPGRNLVGVEVPNDSIATIGLRDILESAAFSQRKGKLTFALGKDITGTPKVCDLDAMPHLLVAGSTGSGKSVCLNVLLISLLYELGPDELKLLLIDPKRVEFVSYNYLPHMLVPKAINDAQQAINALDWAIAEMMRRYTLFAEMGGVRNFKEYNNSEPVLNGEEEKLPYIVIVIDELSDLMILAGRELEEKIQRLTQLARAAGIHLIIATQRPSVDVITGVIKSNLPSRIAFAVTDFASSKTILDKGGAEKLLGKGDMLYAPQNLPEPVRIQCPYVDSKEVVAVVNYIKQHNTAEFDDSISAFITKNDKPTGEKSTGGDNDQNAWDPLLPQALLDFIESGSCSASMIQRRHSIGFVRAGRIVDQMEQAGFISPLDPAKRTRTVLITLDKYNEIFGETEE